MADVAPADTRTLIMEAARRRLLADGYAGLSTRKVADEARVPLSQLHYHFGSKQGLILPLLEDENQRRLDRQSSMYAEDAPLWQRYERACDFLEDDLESGYVRVLQEMIAAGWSNAEIQASRPRPARAAGSPFSQRWPATRSSRFGPLGPFTAEEVATLVGAAFIGAEALLLLGFDREVMPIRSALRRIGVVIRQLEEDAVRHREERRCAHANRSVTATSSATASRSTTRCSAPASRRCCCCRRGRSSTRGTGRCRSRTWRGIAAWSPSTVAATVARTGRPSPRRTREDEFAADALAVMDATGTERAVMVSLSRGAERSLLVAANHPERVDRMVFIGPALPLAAGRAAQPGGPQDFERALDTIRGLGEVQPALLARATTRTSSSSSSSKMFTEPHSTKRVEDCVGWGLETTPRRSR